MIIRVSASAVPDLRPARRLAGPAGPVNGVQGHRAACAAARGCRAAPHPSPTAPGLGRPRGPRRADPAPAPEPADAPAGQITPADLGRPGRHGRPHPPALHVAPLPADPDRHPAHTAALARRASKAALGIPAPDPWTAAHWPGDPARGYRICGELTGPGHKIAPSTIWEILQAARIDPAPQRAPASWKQFLPAQARTIAAVDFFHVGTVFLRRLS